jgi:hypothetical protein
MKFLKFIQLYGFYFLILFISYVGAYGFNRLIIILFYVLYIREFNRIGFIDYKTIIMSLLFLFYQFYIDTYSVYNFIHIFLLIIIYKFYLPHRRKVYRFAQSFKYSGEVNVYSNRIEYKNDSIYYGFELREKEVYWLSIYIYLKCKNLTKLEYKYLDNQYFGNHFYVNIQ